MHLPWLCPRGWGEGGQHEEWNKTRPSKCGEEMKHEESKETAVDERRKDIYGRQGSKSPGRLGSKTLFCTRAANWCRGFEGGLPFLVFSFVALDPLWYSFYYSCSCLLIIRLISWESCGVGE